MKNVCSIYTLKQLEELIEYIDMPLFMVKGISLNYDDLDLDKAIALAKEKGKKIILSFDKMFTPSEIYLAKEYIDTYASSVDYFYITDLGVAYYAMKCNLQNKIIYDPKTMITNRMDLDIYKEMGFSGLGISSEITIEDTISIIKGIEKMAFIQVFGYRLMFYSKRHLISLYSQKNEEEYPKGDVFFRESTRKDYFPGFENENGTAMYRSYSICLLKYIDELKDAFKYFESYRMESDTMIEVLKAFQAKDLDVLNNLHLNIEDGFLYKDSVYQKEELKNE